MDIYNILEKEFQIKREYIDNTIKLIDEGNTIPFIARYRKEMTGEMSDVTLRQLNERLTYLRNLESRKEDVTRIIEEQGKLTEELKKNIAKAKTLQEVEDIYAPYKQKKRTRATIAKEKGLEELQRVTRQRNLAGLRTLIDPRELDQDFRDATLQILDTVLIMSLIVLKDEFDFGTKRLDRFKKRFNDKTECLETGNVTWIDMIEQVREENNIKLNLRKNDVVMAWRRK